MIINNVKYHRDLELSQKLPVSTYANNDIRSLFKTYYEHLKKEEGFVLSHIEAVDPEFGKRLGASQVLGLVQTDNHEANTIVKYKLPEDLGHVRGESEIHHHRVSLKEYFNIDEVILSHRRNKELVINYDRWVKAVKAGHGSLTTLIHRVLGYKFGRTFTHDGMMVFSGESNGKVLNGTKPLALIVPTLDQIDLGWKYYENVDSLEKDGTLDYQILNIHLRLVASNHMFIEDGEVLIRIQLRYPLQAYKRLRDGKIYTEEQA